MYSDQPFRVGDLGDPYIANLLLNDSSLGGGGRMYSDQVCRFEDSAGNTRILRDEAEGEFQTGLLIRDRLVDSVSAGSSMFPQ
jgi:hypothetical protein